MRATDPRAREILERSESLTPDDFMRLHGAIREFRPIADGGSQSNTEGMETQSTRRQQDSGAEPCPFPLSEPQCAPCASEASVLHREPSALGDPFEALEKPAPRSVVIDGAEITRGSRVRLRPRSGGDIFDLALAGRVGIVEAIEQDYDDRLHLSITVEDDPGRELGEARVLGHRFFFSPEEVEPLGR